MDVGKSNRRTGHILIDPPRVELGDTLNAFSRDVAEQVTNDLDYAKDVAEDAEYLAELGEHLEGAANGVDRQELARGEPYHKADVQVLTGRDG